VSPKGSGEGCMGVVACPKHGKGLLFVCPHISTAVINGQSCHEIRYVVYPDADPVSFELGCWFCPCCIEEHSLPPTGTTLLDGDFKDGTSGLCRPMCPGCFEDWQLQGLG